MRQVVTKSNTILLPIFLLLVIIFSVDQAFALDMDEMNKSAYELFMDGNYKESIKIFDEMLEIDPKNYKILEIKGLALSNLRLESTLAMQPQQNMAPRDPSNLNKLSMMEYYKALEINPNSIFALNGMGVGFGNFGEYSEAKRYFEKSLMIDPNNVVTKNYISSIDKIREKYSLDIFETPTKKPEFLQRLEENTIPYWIKNNADWWSKNKINDAEFILGIEYLINNEIMNIVARNSSENS